MGKKLPLLIFLSLVFTLLMSITVFASVPNPYTTNTIEYNRKGPTHEYIYIPNPLPNTHFVILKSPYGYDMTLCPSQPYKRITYSDGVSYDKNDSLGITLYSDGWSDIIKSTFPIYDKADNPDGSNSGNMVYVPDGYYYLNNNYKSIDGNTTTLQQIGLGFNIKMPYNVLSDNMTMLQVSIDGINYNPIFLDTNGNVNKSIIYSDTLRFKADTKTIEGTLNLKYDLVVGTNKLKLYFKDVTGKVWTSTDVVITRTSLPSGGTGGSGTSGGSTGDIRNPFHDNAPVRTDYPDGIVGDVEYGFATLFYWILFPIRLIGELVYTIIDTVTKVIGLSDGITTALSTLFSSFPSWIVTPLQFIFTAMILIAIISFVRGA